MIIRDKKYHQEDRMKKTLIVLSLVLITTFLCGQSISIYPNPFNPDTTISFYLQEHGLVNLSIYNMRGELVKKLVDNEEKSGIQKIKWDGKDEYGKPVSSGMYYFKISTGKYSSTKKMVLLK